MDNQLGKSIVKAAVIISTAILISTSIHEISKDRYTPLGISGGDQPFYGPYIDQRTGIIYKANGVPINIK